MVDDVDLSVFFDPWQGFSPRTCTIASILHSCFPLFSFTSLLLTLSPAPNAYTRYHMLALTCANENAMIPWSDKRQSLRMIDNVDYSIVQDSWQGFSPGIAPLQVTRTCLSEPKRSINFVYK